MPTTRRIAWWTPVFVLAATGAQLAVAEWWPGIERFADKAFGPETVAGSLLLRS